MQQAKGSGMILTGGFEPVMAEVEERRRIVRGVRGADEGIDLLAIGRGPGDHAGTVLGHTGGFIKAKEQGTLQTGGGEEERQLRMKAETFAGEDANLRLKKRTRDVQPFEHIPEL